MKKHQRRAHAFDSAHHGSGAKAALLNHGVALRLRPRLRRRMHPARPPQSALGGPAAAKLGVHRATDIVLGGRRGVCAREGGEGGEGGGGGREDGAIRRGALILPRAGLFRGASRRFHGKRAAHAGKLREGARCRLLLLVRLDLGQAVTLHRRGRDIGGVGGAAGLALPGDEALLISSSITGAPNVLPPKEITISLSGQGSLQQASRRSKARNYGGARGRPMFYPQNFYNYKYYITKWKSLIAISR
jgi:hypothetical protein